MMRFKYKNILSLKSIHQKMEMISIAKSIIHIKVVLEDQKIKNSTQIKLESILVQYDHDSIIYANMSTIIEKLTDKKPNSFASCC